MPKSPTPTVKIYSSVISVAAIAVLVLLVQIAFMSKTLATEGELEVMTIKGTYTRTDSDMGKPQKLSITSEEIAVIKPSSVTSLLRTLPGVNVTQQGGEGGLTFISLRGGEPNFTVVVIDRVKVNDPTNSRGGGFDLAGLDPLLIKNIDLFVGGFSSIYGSEALGGVINITTFDPTSEERSITLEAGDYSARAAALRWTGNIAKDLGYSLFAVTRRASENVPGDRLDRDQFSAQLFSQPEARIQWNGSWFYSEGDASGFPEDSGGDQLAESELLEQRSFRQNNVRLAASGLLNEHWTIDIAGTVSSRREETGHPGIAEGVLSAVPPYLSESKYQRRDISLIANYQSETVATALGTEFSREQGEFNSLIDFGFPIPADFDLARNNVALFAETIVNLSRDLTFGASLRRDDVDEFQQRTHALQLNYILPLASGMLALRYGEGFKVPSFFALGHPLVGNQALQPEESENISLSYSNDFLDDRVHLTASLFQNKFTNLVDFDPLLFTNVNRSRIDVEGAEAQLDWNLNDALAVDASFTYSEYDSIDEVVLRRRPEWKYSASLFWTINSITDFNLRAWYVDDFQDSSIPTGLITSAGHHQLDASLVRNLNEQFELGLMLSNLTNNYFQEAVGFSNPGRQLRVSIAAKF